MNARRRTQRSCNPVTMVMVSVVLVLVLAIATSTTTTTAYVVSVPNVLPVGRQMKLLKELTTDVVQCKPGQLSDQQIAISHELIYAWSHSVMIPNNNHNDKKKVDNNAKKQHMNGKVCAMYVESLVKRVIEEQLAGNVCAVLDIHDYNCLLEGWARSGLGEASALRAEQVLETMQAQGPQPNLSSFKACLMAWRQSNVPYAAARAQRILDWMIRLWRENDDAAAVLPDADCFDIVLQLWSRSGQEGAPQQTEQLLGTMERLYRETGHVQSVKPRQSSFNAVLAAWSKSGTSGSTSSASDRVTDIVSFMELLSESDPSVAPDSVSYNIVMSTYGKHHHHPEDNKSCETAAIKADRFLRHVINTHRQRRETATAFVPDTILFNIAMGLWAKTGQTRSYRKARSILDQQLTLHKETNGAVPPPDIVGWTSVISSCAAEPGNAEERNKAMQVAISTYRQMQNMSSRVTGNNNCEAAAAAAAAAPNHVTYGTMLKACARLHPIRSPLRHKWARIVFQDAIAAGSVGDMVVSKLREAAPTELYKELMQGYTKTKLPAEWTCNVHEQSPFRLRKKQHVVKRAEV